MNGIAKLNLLSELFLSMRILTRLGFGMLFMISEKGARKEMESTVIDMINLFLKISFYSLLFSVKKIDLIFLFKKIRLHLIDIRFNSEFSISGISKNCYDLEILPNSALSNLFDFILNAVRSPAEPEREMRI
jgi:hypothetical protein